eukprot:11620219-Ditylum_brightwellii.AAC.1
MKIRYFWLVDQVAQGNFDVQWGPGLENLVTMSLNTMLLPTTSKYAHFTSTPQPPRCPYPAHYHLVFCKGVLILPRTKCLDTIPVARQTKQRTEH